MTSFGKIQGVMHGTWGAADYVSPSSYYYMGATCVEQANPVGYSFWRYKPLPAWFRDALPDAPYTLSQLEARQNQPFSKETETEKRTRDSQ